MWEERILILRPKHILELGTGQGATGARIMMVLPPQSKFTTVNYAYPEDYAFGEQLHPWSNDPRLKMVVGDTTDLLTLDLVDGGVDMMFMDTTHEAYVACEELRLWQAKLVDGATIFVDDLSHNDMRIFWESLPYVKHLLPHDQGVFIYDKPYTASIVTRTLPDFEQRRLYIDRRS